jgi:hypothetical protein
VRPLTTAQEYVLTRPLPGLASLKLHPPTLRLLVRYGAPYKLQRTTLEGGKVEHKLTTDFRRLVRWVAEMARIDEAQAEKLHAEDLAPILLIIRGFTLQDPEILGGVFDDLVFNDRTRLDSRTVEEMTPEEALVIRERAVKYSMRMAK